MNKHNEKGVVVKPRTTECHPTPPTRQQPLHTGAEIMHTVGYINNM